MGLLDKLRKKREELIAAKKRRELLYQENGIYAFYERSMQLSYSTIGHVYLITPDEVLECDTPSNTSHKMACENLLSEKYHKNVELSDDYRDFGNQVAEEYNTIFVRMVSIVNNVSMLFYPKKINEFQLKELKKFKEQLDEYNAMHKNAEKAEVIFFDLDGNESKDLDKLVDDLEKGLYSEKGNNI